MMNFAAGISTFPCRSRCTRCCHAEWGSLVPPGKWSTACRWSTRCATDALQRRCTWPLPDLHNSEMLRAHVVSVTAQLCQWCQSKWGKKQQKTTVTHWWLAWCSWHISWHRGCWSIQGNKGNFPCLWNAAPTVASYSWCTGNTRDARVSPDRSPLLLWWPGNDKKIRMNLCCLAFFSFFFLLLCLVLSVTCGESLHCQTPQPTFLQAQHWYAYCFSKQGTQK